MKPILKKKFAHNPFLTCLPFLLYYMYFIVKNKWPTLYGDEIRYVDFATNLTHGFYSPSPPHINLWNGPGYPIMLMGFVALKIPALYITLMNALYQYLSIVFLYKAIQIVSNHKTALLFAVLLAVYPNILPMLPILYTEAFTGFLVSLLVYSVTLYYVKANTGCLLLTGVVLGWLVLTKVIFGYVIVICLFVCVPLLLFKNLKANGLKSIKILLIAFSIATPYLAYTYYITGKVFYWGDAGGMSLYWMSTPYPHEYGDWKVPDLSNNQYPSLFKSKEVVALLKKNHGKELAFILKHNELEQDELFKQAAIKNIKQNPSKFLSNYYNNFCRMLFNFPYTYAFQDAAIVGNIIRGSLILWVSLISIFLTYLNWRRIIYPVKFTLLIAAVYLTLSGVLSAYPRQLDVIMPVLLFWIAFLSAKMPRLRLKFPAGENPVKSVTKQQDVLMVGVLKPVFV